MPKAQLSEANRLRVRMTTMTTEELKDLVEFAKGLISAKTPKARMPKPRKPAPAVAE